MSIQIHDEPTAAALSAATGPEEVHAPDGRLLGRFIPAAVAETYIPELDITVEELERRRTDPNAKWYTPEEVMARLREIDECSRLNWLDVALDELADIYVAATPDERARMAAGVDALNTRLRSDPLNEGESRPGGRRLTFTPLLSVGFYVSIADRVVQVTRVKRYGK